MSAEPLRPGDPVTLVMVDHVVMVTVDVATRAGFSCKLTTRGGKTLDSPWQLDKEGTDWLRGYHVADSPAVKACQSAQALLPKRGKKAFGPPPGLQAVTTSVFAADSLRDYLEGRTGIEEEDI